MKQVIVHGLDKPLAKKATVKAFESYKERFAEFNPQDTWVTEDKADVSFSVKGVALKGGIEVREKEIELELTVPLLLRPFQKRALGVIEEEVREWVEKARKGELD